MNPLLSRRRFLGLAAAAATLPTACAPGASPHFHSSTTPASSAANGRVRLRDLGIVIGEFAPGPYNAITDVPGVAVGHATVIRGHGPLVVGEGPVRAGVTAILPHTGQLWTNPVRVADHTLNGNGEFTGLGPLRRTGLLGAPILLTDTTSVGRVHDGAVAWMLARDADALHGVVAFEPVVGETWGGTLNDSEGRHLGAEQTAAALNAATDGTVAEGNVGGGTPMRAFEFKAGIGTASRRVTAGDVERPVEFTLGVLVQSNFGSRELLRVNGVPVGAQIPELQIEKIEERATSNSALVVIATDAPLIPVQLEDLCKRCWLGLARTGGISTPGSGDLAIAFSTPGLGPERAERRLNSMSALIQATVESTEEAILNSLTMAQTMTGRDDNRIHALPLDRLQQIVRRHGMLQ
ncbi:MAG: P1 family peptidase [Candidatus Latescibacterota bacterium]|nr:P1 family peptidase [Candidatus Latescibacterota bacterium]